MCIVYLLQSIGLVDVFVRYLLLSSISKWIKGKYVASTSLNIPLNKVNLFCMNYGNTTLTIFSKFVFDYPVYQPCSSEPCQNNGVCQPDLSGYDYSCQCVNGFTGRNCETSKCLCFTVLLYLLTVYIFSFRCIRVHSMSEMRNVLPEIRHFLHEWRPFLHEMRHFLHETRHFLHETPFCLKWETSSLKWETSSLKWDILFRLKWEFLT